MLVLAWPMFRRLSEIRVVDVRGLRPYGPEKRVVHLEEQARQLSAEERAKLAQALLESLHAPVAEVEPAWSDEIDRRDSGVTRCRSLCGSLSVIAVNPARLVSPARREFLKW